VSSDPPDFSSLWVALLQSKFFPCQNNRAEQKENSEDIKS